jgi:hypothetical protein
MAGSPSRIDPPTLPTISLVVARRWNFGRLTHLEIQISVAKLPEELSSKSTAPASRKKELHLEWFLSGTSFYSTKLVVSMISLENAMLLWWIIPERGMYSWHIAKGGIVQGTKNKREIKSRTQCLGTHTQLCQEPIQCSPFQFNYSNMQRWASTLTSRSNARHLSNTRPSIERSEISYFFENQRQRSCPLPRSLSIVDDHDC